MFLNAQNPNYTFNKPEYGNEIVNKWKMEKNKSDISFDSHVCVYYDAWENDGDDDPMLSIVYSILNNSIIIIIKISVKNFYIFCYTHLSY